MDDVINTIARYSSHATFIKQRPRLRWKVEQGNRIRLYVKSRDYTCVLISVTWETSQNVINVLGGVCSYRCVREPPVAADMLKDIQRSLNIL